MDNIGIMGKEREITINYHSPHFVIGNNCDNFIQIYIKKKRSKFIDLFSRS